MASKNAVTCCCGMPASRASERMRYASTAWTATPRESRALARIPGPHTECASSCFDPSVARHLRLDVRIYLCLRDSRGPCIGQHLEHAAIVLLIVDQLRQRVAAQPFRVDALKRYKSVFVRNALV